MVSVDFLTQDNIELGRSLQASHGPFTALSGMRVQLSVFVYYNATLSQLLSAFIATNRADNVMLGF